MELCIISFEIYYLLNMGNFIIMLLYATLHPQTQSLVSYPKIYFL